MFLYARKAKPDDVGIMLNLFLPPSRHSPEVRERERCRWERLWAACLPQGVILEDIATKGEPEPVAIMVAAPVLPEIHDRIAAPGMPPLLDGLADAAEAGEAILGETRLGRANAGEGMDLVVCWLGYGDAPHSKETLSSLRGHTVAAFQSLLSGNRLRRFTLETDDPAVAERFESYRMAPIREESGRVVLSLHREEALTSPDLSSQRFFAYDPPLLGFSAAQRAILLLARQGYTDQEIATALDKTTDSVKKRWAGIYARFAAVFPGRLPASGDGSRGQEKRRTLLTYLRDRPEELRPYSTKAPEGSEAA